MKTEFKSGNVLLRKAQSKNKQFSSQLEIVHITLYSEPKTVLMVFAETGLSPRKIRLLISEIRKTGEISKVGKTYCQHSGHKAEYYTTNPELMYSEKYGWRLTIVKPSKKQ